MKLSNIKIKSIIFWTFLMFLPSGLYIFNSLRQILMHLASPVKPGEGIISFIYITAFNGTNYLKPVLGILFATMTILRPLLKKHSKVSMVTKIIASTVVGLLILCDITSFVVQTRDIIYTIKFYSSYLFNFLLELIIYSLMLICLLGFKLKYKTKLIIAMICIAGVVLSIIDSSFITVLRYNAIDIDTMLIRYLVNVLIHSFTRISVILWAILPFKKENIIVKDEEIL